MAIKQQTGKAMIRRRLKRFLTARGGVYPLHAHGPFAEGTVKNWVGGRESLPSLERAAELAQKTGLSLDWLVTGEGSEFRGGPAPRADVARELRSHVAAVMMPEFGPLAETALPIPEVMLVEVTDSYRERIAAVLRSRRRRGVREELAKATADDSPAAHKVRALVREAVGRRTVEGADPFSERVEVVVSPETLSEFGQSELYGGGGATPEWSVPTIVLIPGEPDSQ